MEQGAKTPMGFEKERYSLKGVEIRYIHPKESGRFRSVV